MKIKIIETLKK